MPPPLRLLFLCILDANALHHGLLSGLDTFESASAKLRVIERTQADVARLSTISAPREWMIAGGKLYLRRDSKAIGKKAPGNDKRMKDMVASLLENSCAGFPDVTFDVDAGSGGTNVTETPVLAIARKLHGKAVTTGGILVPNPYFEGLKSWGKKTKLYLHTAKQVGWDQKDGHAFWRGDYDTQQKESADGNRERLEAAKFAKMYPQFLDVKVADEKWTIPEHFCYRKYLLNLPGAKRGSYSRNLNHLWTTRSVVMQWETEPGQGLNFDEWYYPGLVPNVTHVQVGPHNVAGVVNFLQQHDQIAQQIGAMGPAVHDTFLCPCCISDHFLSVFHMIKAKMAFDPKTVLASQPYNWVEVQPKDKERRQPGEQCTCSHPA